MRTIAPASTDQTLVVHCYDEDGEPVTLTHASAGLTLAYRRDSNGREGTPVAMTPVARLVAGTHRDGAITHVGDGKHEIDVPDLACASGAETVTVELAATGVDQTIAEKPVLDVDVSTRAAPADVKPTIFPVVATVNGGPVPPTCLTAYRKAGITHRVTVTNADGTLPDLSGKTLVFVASTLKDIEVIYAETVTVEGDDDNEIVVELDGEAHNLTAGQYRYAVWEGEYPAGTIWAQGDYTIEPVGGPHIEA